MQFKNYITKNQIVEDWMIDSIKMLRESIKAIVKRQHYVDFRWQSFREWKYRKFNKDTIKSQNKDRENLL